MSLCKEPQRVLDSYKRVLWKDGPLKLEYSVGVSKEQMAVCIYKVRDSKVTRTYLLEVFI